MESKILRVNWSDLGKGILLAIAVAVVGALHQLLQEKGFNLSLADLASLGEIALKTLIGYIALSLGTNSKGKFGRKEK